MKIISFQTTKFPVWLTSADLDTRTRKILVRFSGSRLVNSWLVKSDHNRLFRSIFASIRNRHGKNFHDILNFDASRVVRVLPQYSYSLTREYPRESRQLASTWATLECGPRNNLSKNQKILILKGKTTGLLEYFKKKRIKKHFLERVKRTKS